MYKRQYVNCGEGADAAKYTALVEKAAGLGRTLVLECKDPEIEMCIRDRSVGAKGITVSGVCCTSNEVAMRRGVPMAGNFLQQENVCLLYTSNPF